MNKLKIWLYNFWWEFKQDPFFFLLLWIAWIFMALLVVSVVVLICTGQMSDSGDSHGINLIPMYNGDNVTFMPMPY